MLKASLFGTAVVAVALAGSWIAPAATCAQEAPPQRPTTETTDPEPPPPAPEAPPPAAVDVAPITVWGRRADAIGTADSASEGVVRFGAFATRPLLRPGELAEVVPGLAATQHSGTGKANQYFLRGFNIDHGTDFSVFLDGVPLNLPTHAHGQGYLDLNGVTPELVETIRYHKGPYFPELGDFSLAGSAAFESFNDVPGTFVDTTIGQYGYGRVLGVARLGADTYVAADLGVGDGPWDRPEALRRGALTARFMAGDWAITARAYGARWFSTDQVPQRAVDGGQISRFGLIDDTDGGETSRFILSARRQTEDGWDAVAYVQRYRLNLWSDFTYFLNDPVNGDQFEQADDRWIYGASLSRRFPDLVAGWALRAGGDVRYDRIDAVGLYLTRARQRLTTVRQDRVDQVSGDVWGQAERAFGPVRVSLGARVDGMAVDVASDNRRNSGDARDAVVSPSLAIAWRVNEGVELYANVGRGFHSNDARGATTRVDPSSGDLLDPVRLYARGNGGEIGGRYRSGGFSLTGAVWALDLDSELIYVGDEGVTEIAGATRRVGLEVLADWTPASWLTFNLTAAATHARFRDDPAGGDRIPNALEYIVTGGVTARLTDRDVATLTVRRLGPAPLIEDGSVSSDPSTLTNLLLRHEFGRVTANLEVLNLLDSGDDDIQYFYASRLQGEPADGVDDRHFHPFEPRTFRLGLRVSL